MPKPLRERRTINERLTVILPDTHFGEHDPVATDLAARIVEATKPARVVQLGDLLECGPFSSWATHKVALAKEYNFTKNEVQPARAWIERILKHTNLYVQHEGNHEYRVERAALGSDFGGAIWEMIDPRRVILRDYPSSQVKWVPYINTADITGHYRVLPDLITIHGWSIAEQAAEIHLRKSAMTGCSVVYGHTHRKDERTTRNPFTDKLLLATSAGCLRTLNPHFTQAKGPTNWSQGITMVWASLHNPKDWTLFNVPFYKGRAIVPDGREIKA